MSRRRCGLRAALRVARRIVDPLGDPESVEKHCKLAGHGDHRSLLGVFASALGQFKADIAVNAVAQVRLIQAAREAAPNAVVVHASTRQFYGRPRYLPVDENHPVNPPDANGVSKFAGEQYWMLEHRVQGRPVVSLRLTNCYGPRLRIRDARQTFLGILCKRPAGTVGGGRIRHQKFRSD